MPHGSLATLADLLGRPCRHEGTFSSISTDTRTLAPGSLFVALRGETFDGHDFVPQALEQGAVLAITDRPVEGSYLQVPDTLVAYQTLAHWWRGHFSIPIIGITGSAGKTTTKEMAAAALSRYGSVLKNVANHNNDIGVAQTLLQIEPQHQFVVLEMAMRGPGEIRRLADMARPTHALITNIGSAHIGRLGSRAAIAEAKCELLEVGSLTHAVLNGEDPLLLATAATRSGTYHTLTFGLDQGDIGGAWDPQSQVVEIEGLRIPVPLAGRHHALNWLSVLALLKTLDLDWQGIQDPVDLPTSLPGRNQIITLPNDIQLLDETYNAAPEAMIAALQALCQMPGRHGAVLGGMRELGDHAPELYAQVGSVAAQLDLAYVLVLDPDGEMDPLVQALPQAQVFRDVEEVIGALGSLVQRGDRVLFKAARAVALERVIEGLIRKLS